MTMDELATGSGVSKRTLYRYFRSKDEMIEAVLEKHMNDAASRIDESVNASLTPGEIVKHILHALHRLCADLFNPRCWMICSGTILITGRK